MQDHIPIPNPEILTDVHRRSKKAPSLLPNKYMFMGKEHPIANGIYSAISRAFTTYLHSGVEPQLRKRAGKWRECLGCTLESYKAHLESTWAHGMAWDNYGEFWRVYYIKPLSSFDMRVGTNMLAAFNYLNTKADTFAGKGRPIDAPLYVSKDDGTRTLMSEGEARFDAMGNIFYESKRK